MVIRYETVYIETKIQHKMKEVYGAHSHKMDELILRKHQVDGTQLLIYIYIHVYILPYFHQNKIFRFVVTMYLTKLYE